MITFGCPHCRYQMETDDSDAGKVVGCGRCGKPIQLPEATTALPALPPEDRSPKQVQVTFGGGRPSFEERVFVIVGWGTVAVIVGAALLTKLLGRSVMGFYP